MDYILLWQDNVKEIRLNNLSYGQVDGSDGDQIPVGAFYTLDGLEVADHKYPRKMKDWYMAATPNTQVVTGVACVAGSYWERPTGTVYEVGVLDGAVWRLTTGHQKVEILNLISDGVDSGTITTNVITPSSTADLVESLRVGDKFYFDADTYTEAVTITAVSAAAFTVNSYGGSATAGAYSVIRTLTGSEIDIAPVGNRLFFTDGTLRPQWFGDDGDGWV